MIPSSFVVNCYCYGSYYELYSLYGRSSIKLAAADDVAAGRTSNRYETIRPYRFKNDKKIKYYE